MRTRSIEKHFYLNYLRKAEEFLQQTEKAIEDKNWNAAVSLAIHSGICAADALCVFNLGVRNSGEGHDEVVQLINKLNIKDLNIKTRQLLNLLDIKNTAEYTESLMTEKNALSSKQNAERFLSFVKDNLGK